MTDTVPPQNLEAEAAVLGACMMAPAAIDAALDVLKPDDFYVLSNGRLFAEIVKMHAAGDKVDSITLSDRLPEEKTRIVDLANSVPDSVRAGRYALIVKEHAVLRGLITAGGELVRLGQDRPDEVPALLEQAEQIVFALADTTSGEAVSLPVEVKRVYEELLAMDGKPRELLGVPSGLLDLDRLTRGFRAGDLAVLAADTGRGKSALWLGIALHLAVTLGKPVAAFSLEMSETELVQRALSLLASVPHDRLTRGDIKPDEWRKVSNAAQELWEAPLSLWTDATVRPAGIRSLLRRWKAKNPDGALAVVDYLQLLTPDEKTDNRTQDVSSISRALKVTAMDLGLPVMAISQFHRRPNPNERPYRHNLRESGSIENDASLVLLLHRPGTWDTDPQRSGTAELYVDKNRHGPEDMVMLKWHKEQMRFSNLVHEARAAA